MKPAPSSFMLCSANAEVVAKPNMVKSADQFFDSATQESNNVEFATLLFFAYLSFRHSPRVPATMYATLGPNHAFNRTRRYASSFWRAAVAARRRK